MILDAIKFLSISTKEFLFVFMGIRSENDLKRVYELGKCAIHPIHWKVASKHTPEEKTACVME